LGQGADAVFGCTRQEQNGAENCIKKTVIIIPYHFLRERQKRRRSTWSRPVTDMEDIRKAYKILIGKPKGRTSLEEISSGGRIILKLILNSMWWY
jgi:hypothetical protein